MCDVSNSTDISAKTGLVALLGHPVSHSLSPQIQNAAFRERGLALVYLAFDVPPDDLEAAVQGLKAVGFRGANVTVPHKEAVLPLLDEVAPLAATVGAVNTLVYQDAHLRGHNTDVDGFLQALEAGWRRPEGETCLVLGAGGAGRAVLAGLLAAGAGRVLLYNRTAQRAEDLCSTAVGWGEGRCQTVTAGELSEALRQAKLVVNATSIGLKDGVKTYPLRADELTEEHVVMDLVYGSGPTPLLHEARKRGAITIDGSEMLVRQAALAFELWTGTSAPVEVMRRWMRD